MIEIVAQQVWLIPGATDMRKSIDGLAAVVNYAIQQDPLSRQLFAFCSKDRSKLKILFWDQNGFWLFYKRLEKGRFRWPANASAEGMCITRRQLAWLMDGLSVEQKSAHRPVPALIAA
jgi:transposase